MTKSDLRTGMRVTLRNGLELIVLLNFKTNSVLSSENIMVALKKHDWMDLKNYSEDLAYSDKWDIGDRSFDIVKIEIPSHGYDLFVYNLLDKSKFTTIWELQEPKPMTLEEIEKELGYPIKIIK